jgi:hypothetical protein
VHSPPSRQRIMRLNSLGRGLGSIQAFFEFKCAHLKKGEGNWNRGEGKERNGGRESRGRKLISDNKWSLSLDPASPRMEPG